MINATGTTYVDHDFINPKDKPAEYFKYVKDKSLPNHAHWPHFSLNPCLIKKSIFEKTGLFDTSSNQHVSFEYNFGLNYHEKCGFHSIFLNDILFFNIGKPRNENSKIKIPKSFLNVDHSVNAYELNK